MKVTEREEQKNMEEDTQKEVVQNMEGNVDDYILVKFILHKSKDPKHYIGKIIVSFYRQSRKMPGKSVTPVAKDIAPPINKTDIVMYLPQPESVGGTKRVAACLHFDVQLEKYNCQ